MNRLLAFIFLVAISCIAANSQIRLDYSKINSHLSDISQMEDDSTKVKSLFSIIDSYPDGYSERLDYALQALELSEKAEWNAGIGMSYYYIAWYYFYTAQRDLAIENFLKVLKYSEDTQILVYTYGCISNSYSWEGKPGLALLYATKGLDLVEKTDNTQLKADALIFMGDVFRYKDDMVKARFYYIKALSVMDKKIELVPSMSRMSVYVYLIDSAIDSPASILNFAFRMKNVYDNANPQEKQIQVLTLVKIALAYIVSTEKGNIKKIQVETDQKLKVIYIVGIFFLIVITVVLYWQNELRRKAINELARANEMKSRFFGILNHDLRRPVAGLISYLQLKTDAPDIINAEDAAAFEKRTMETAKNLLDNMEELLFWCKDQMQNFTPDFKYVLVSKLFEDTKSFFNYETSVNIVFEGSQDIKLKTDENYLKTIMRNLTSNAITAVSDTENSTIYWRAQSLDNKVILSITNNGGAISQDKIDILYNSDNNKNIKEGLGLKIIRDLSISIQCKIIVETNEDMGETTFKLIFE
ncbi:MAG: HAMP domain-containing sensor histidine kinase [Dysgonomonas sp.]|nr:HAMP domain-containing sensor histidine kinase [Dysgonomonas sp.]